VGQSHGVADTAPAVVTSLVRMVLSVPAVGHSFGLQTVFKVWTACTGKTPAASQQFPASRSRAGTRDRVTEFAAKGPLPR